MSLGKEGALVLGRRGGRVDTPQGPGVSVPPGSENTAYANGPPRNLRGPVLSTDESRAGAPGDQLQGPAARAFGADGSQSRTLGWYRQPKATKGGAPLRLNRPVTSAGWSPRRSGGARAVVPAKQTGQAQQPEQAQPPPVRVVLPLVLPRRRRRGRGVGRLGRRRPGRRQRQAEAEEAGRDPLGR
jgi:hypothetical protein